MRLLVVNWQDRENPQAGGAELHLHEIFGRLARRGHEVTLLCGGWAGCPQFASLDGIEVIRAGTRLTFPFVARRAWQRHLARRPFDLLIEDINKVPLFTPLWGRGRLPVVGLVPHLFGSTAFQELPAPAAAAVWLAEKPIPRIYRGVPFQVISESTADDLVRRGVDQDLVSVIYCGIDTVAYTPDESLRAPRPHFAYLGRLRRYKRVDIIIRAFAEAAIPGSKLEVAGAGNDRDRLESLARSLDLGEAVTFLGRINEEEKKRLLRRSWALALTSPKEGWGITNLEAAASGTPVLASDSPGLDESVRDGETGFLLPHGDVGALAAAMKRLAGDIDLVRQMGGRGREFAKSFTWDRSALETETDLERILAALLDAGGTSAA
ncbi:MAG: glycosyltransferase family 4 protein [Gemmatimonadota bacterium]